MATCFNCRKPVSRSADRCPYCGVAFRSGTWKSQTDLLDAAPGGWGLAPATYGSIAFRVGAVLCPVWLPLIVGMLAGPDAQPAALALLLALFIFIPGVYVLANLRSWGKLLRLLASMGYVVVSGVAAFWVLSGIKLLWRA